MTHHPTDSRLLTYALTPWNRGALLRVSPVLAHTIWLGKPGLWRRLLDGLRGAWHTNYAVASSRPDDAVCGLALPLLEAGAGEPGRGCKICRDAHFELGAAAAGQEYF